MDVFTVDRVTDFFSAAKEIGIEIVAADYNSDFEYRTTEDVTKYKRKDKGNVMLVLGSEGRGIADSLKPLCDRAVYITKGNAAIDKFPYSLIDSLNVSVSSGILLQNIIHK